jgi:hypothetical protein
VRQKVGDIQDSGVAAPKPGRPQRLANRLEGDPRRNRHAVSPTSRTPALAAVPSQPPAPQAAGQGAAADHPPQALATPDWLRHTLTVIGPADRLAAFRHAAAGPGLVPMPDRDSLQEDVTHALLAPAPALRGGSVAGARILAEQIGEQVEIYAARMAGRAASCPLDLHALVPVPQAVLCLPPADRRVSASLWRHWGTTWPLRHVAVSEPAVANSEGHSLDLFRRRIHRNRQPLHRCRAPCRQRPPSWQDRRPW